MSIRRYCRIFLRSFDAHFFVFAGGESFKFSSFMGNFEPNFPAVFFAGIRATSCATFRPHHIGRQRRPFKGCVGFLGHSTTQVSEMYYVKKDMKMLDGVTNDFCL